MQRAARSLSFTLVVALGVTIVASVPARTAGQTRPVDLEYQKNPAKRAADLGELKTLLGGIEKEYATAEASLAAGRKKDAADQFIGVARSAGRALILYESLGFNFKNEKLGYPHYLVYKLESYLTGTKETKGRNGETIIGPADPGGAKILSYAGVLQRPGQPPPRFDEHTDDIGKLHHSAGKVMEFMRDKIVAANVPLQ